MVQLVSRPIPSRPFDYRFDCVLGGHPLDDEVTAALAEMHVETARLRVFGSYVPTATRAGRRSRPSRSGLSYAASAATPPVGRCPV